MGKFSGIKTLFIVGLGNIGSEYENTRHNAGFVFIDKFLELNKLKPLKEKKDLFCYLGKYKIRDKEFFLAKPATYMNESGKAVIAIFNFYTHSRKKMYGTHMSVPLLQPTNLILIHDDLDIALGKFKIQFGKGPKEHGGVSSVEKILKTKNFWHIRIGAENRNENLKKRISGKDFVLKKLNKNEKQIFEEAIIVAIEKFIEECGFVS